jgi:hypothetical protein
MSTAWAAAKAGKGKAVPAKAPLASTKEMEKLKGEFKWGMNLDEVAAVVQQRIEAAYADRIEKSNNDPNKQDRVRKEMRAEIVNIKKNYLAFEGQKSGYDVSIIDQEFAQGVNESLLLAKEESSTRYFFFAHDKLYKMFIAFDKEMLQGRGFSEFGAMMQGRFGKAREVFIEQKADPKTDSKTDSKTKAGPKKKLDHYVWGSKGGDALRLVDRSEFYDVYCLVLYDAETETRQAEARKAQDKGPARRDPLVEAVTGAPVNDRDPNDNVIDTITGKTIRKPGDDTGGGNIVVPSPVPKP